jgi:hypothetical protein
MAQLHTSGALDIKPDVINYSCVIHCWAKYGHKEAPEATQKLLRTMQQKYLVGDKSSRPDAITYFAVISAFARARQAERAGEFLEEMYSNYLDGNNSAKLDVISFGTILDALAKSKSHDALQYSKAILKRMAQLHALGGLDTKPDAISYSSVINCWAKSGCKDASDATPKLLRTNSSTMLETTL